MAVVVVEKVEELGQLFMHVFYLYFPFSAFMNLKHAVLVDFSVILKKKM